MRLRRLVYSRTGRVFPRHTPTICFSLFLRVGSCRQVEEQLQKTSGDGRTVLMHGALCGDQMGVLAVTHACKRFLPPYKVSSGGGGGGAAGAGSKTVRGAPPVGE